MGMVYDLIIIGGGPAGITAGIYAARQKLNTLLITKAFAGQMARKAVAIENYPGFDSISGLDLIKKFESHLRKQKAEIKLDTVIKVKKSGTNFTVLTGSKKQYQAKSVIIASGADPRPLEVPGEKKYIGKGVSYCVACDGPLYSGKEVVVIGGGNSGFEAALSLTNYVKKVYILEAGSKIRADELNQQKVQKTGKVEVITSAKIKQIKGKDFVESVVYEDKQAKKTKVLNVEGVFVEIGSQPATSFVGGLVDFNKKDEIIVDHQTGKTKTRGLFAAGDVDNLSFKQIVIAAGEGAKAALAVSSYLQSL
jgi:thioredoxin-disulfide reductase